MPLNYNVEFTTIDLTYNCTLRCKHCFNNSGEVIDKFLTDEEILNLVEEIAEINPSAICLCGGEPFLRIKLMIKLIEKLRKKLGNNVTINTVTNGELVTDENIKRLKKAGISNIQVSLDGATEDTYEWLRGKKGSFNNAINAIKIIKNNNIKCMVSCLFTKYNLHEFEDVIELCKSLNVDFLRMQPLMMLGRAKKFLKDYQLSDIECRKLASKIMKKSKQEKNIKLEWGDPVQHIIKNKNALYTQIDSIGIDAFGGIALSPYIPVTFGNVKNNSLIEIANSIEHLWETPFVQYLIKDVYSTDDLDIGKNIQYIPEINDDIYIDVTVEEISNLKSSKEIEQFLKDKRGKR